MTEYFRPIPVTDPAERSDAHILAGGWCRFSMVEVLSRTAPPRIVPARDIPSDRLAVLTSSRAPIAGLTFDMPRVMGVLNVTPDSFSDGGRTATVTAAVRRAQEMVAEGVDLIDLGGESTRPGAAETPVAEEIARVVPVLDALAQVRGDVPLSLDTRKSEVAEAGLRHGAAIVNDVSGLRHDPKLAHVAAESGAPLILMHSLGTPESMQHLASDAYANVLLDVFDSLSEAVAAAVAAGVKRERILVDPGIGFGKTEAQNLALLSRISLFHGLGCPILLGVSRKGFIGRIGRVADPAARGPGSAGVGLWAVAQGIQMLRIHDIDMHVQAIRLWHAVAVGRDGTARAAHE